MALLVDTHCHFEPADDANALVAEAQACDVRVLAVGGSASLNQTARASGAPFALGYDWSWDGETLPPIASDPAQLAVGELGFDLHYAQGPAVEARQRALFELQADFARSRALPVIIHTREADALTLEALRAAALPRGGVIHSFTGTDPAFAKALLDLGFYLSFSGILTFRNAAKLREIARLVPADRLLVETDSPYLAPVPHRGQRNRPALVRTTAQALADLRQVPFEQLAHETTANAVALFGRGILGSSAEAERSP